MGNVFEELSKPLRDTLKKYGYETPTEPQEKAIPLILKGRNTLIIAPSGTGKTEAALLPVFDLFLRSQERSRVSILYVTPLRALNRDILRRMASLAEDLGLRVEVRHGDTSVSQRRRQALTPPHMLITTPETLQAILPGKLMRSHLKSVKWVIIDEIHDLVSDKRGVQFAIALERLKDIVKRDFQRIGLSATVGSVDKVKGFLKGSSGDVEVVYVPASKGLRVTVDLPQVSHVDEEYAAKLCIQPAIASRLRRILEVARQYRSVLVFTNTRETAELLASRLRALKPGFNVKAHHGSLSVEERVEAESGFKAGSVKLLVCTSSLELGIDVGTVDYVVQYMSPRQVTPFLQRVGRSGHRVGFTSLGSIIPTSPDDICESTVIARMALKEELEPIVIHENALDVLAHQLVGILLDKGKASIDEAYLLIKRAYPYRGLSLEDFKAVAKFMEGLGLVKLKGHLLRPSPRKAWSYYFENISMIPDVKRFEVVDLVERRPIGSLDEEFVAFRGQRGSTFILAGRAWNFVGVEEDKVYVEPSSDSIGAIPSWEGELIPVPFDVAREVGALRGKVEEALTKGQNPLEPLQPLQVTREAALKVVEAVKAQLLSGVPVPTDKRLVVEGLGNYVVVHACLGSKVNESLAMILAGLLSGKLGATVNYRVDPYRILLILPTPIDPKAVMDVMLSIKPEEVEQLLEPLIKSSNTYSWRLLHVAKRFGSISREASLRVVRMLPKLYEGTVVERAAKEEVVVDKLDVAGLKHFLEELGKGSLKVEVREGRLEEGVSPFAAPILNVSVFHEVGPIGKPVAVLIDVLRGRLLSREVKLICMFCGGWESIVKVGSLPDDVKCPKCGARFIAVTWKGDKSIKRVLSLRRSGKQLSKQDLKVLEAAQRSGGLVLSYGKKAVVAMAAHGVGPQTATRILAKHRSSEEEFYLDILEAERQYARTRAFWDEEQHRRA
ncbi:MAG: DEAD/DEAH box helicase [Candidatus Nezhaarchaeales archaeon]